MLDSYDEVRGGRVGAVTSLPRRSSKTYRRGRLCSAKGCGTVLSIYNSDTACAEHARPVDLRSTLGVQQAPSTK